MSDSATIPAANLPYILLADLSVLGAVFAAKSALDGSDCHPGWISPTRTSDSANLQEKERKRARDRQAYIKCNRLERSPITDTYTLIHI